ncbi:hypothetical protein CIMG_02747, partial [Paecilomyces variotii No. 5]
MIRDMKRLQRRITNYQTRYWYPAPQEWIKELNAVKKSSKHTIQQFRTQTHRDRITEYSQSMHQVWGLVRWTKDHISRYLAYTPPLQGRHRIVYLPEQKADLLTETFFPNPPVANLNNIWDFPYLDEVEIPKITEPELQQVIQDAGVDKAPGPDGIPNRVLQATTDTLTLFLTSIFNHCLRRGY